MDAGHEIPRDIIRLYGHQDPKQPDRMVFDHPKLRYLTKEQAQEWLRVGTYSNIHTRSNESLIIESQLGIIRNDLEGEVTIVDFGCGDGTKASHLIPLLEVLGHRVAYYIPVDVSSTLIDSATRRVLEWTDLKGEQCIGICSSFEEVLQRAPSWKVDQGKATTVLGLFLGNTYNNYAPDVGNMLLQGLAAMCDCLLLGVKVRRDSSDKEIARIIHEYQSYGDAFTFSFGRVLGLDEKSMARRVDYNPTLHRVEIAIQITNPSSLEDLVQRKTKELLVCCSYRPTLDEIITRLAPSFLMEWWSLESSNDVVFRLRAHKQAQ